MIFSLNALLKVQAIARFSRLNCLKNEQLAGDFIDMPRYALRINNFRGALIVKP